MTSTTIVRRKQLLLQADTPDNFKARKYGKTIPAAIQVRRGTLRRCSNQGGINTGALIGAAVFAGVISFQGIKVIMCGSVHVAYSFFGRIKCCRHPKTQLHVLPMESSRPTCAFLGPANF